MGAITGTLAKNTEFSGEKKLIIVTAPIASASDTITLVAATHGISVIDAILGVVITGGIDADFAQVQATFSGLVITVVSKNAAGGASTEWTGTTISLAILGY